MVGQLAVFLNEIAKKFPKNCKKNEIIHTVFKKVETEVFYFMRNGGYR